MRKDLTDAWQQATDPANERGEICTGYFYTGLKGSYPVILDFVDIEGEQNSAISRSTLIAWIGKDEVVRWEHLVQDGINAKEREAAWGGAAVTAHQIDQILDDVFRDYHARYGVKAVLHIGEYSTIQGADEIAALRARMEALFHKETTNAD